MHALRQRYIICVCVIPVGHVPGARIARGSVLRRYSAVLAHGVDDPFAPFPVFVHTAAVKGHRRGAALLSVVFVIPALVQVDYPVAVLVDLIRLSPRVDIGRIHRHARDIVIPSLERTCVEPRMHEVAHSEVRILKLDLYVLLVIVRRVENVLVRVEFPGSIALVGHSHDIRAQ